ncbi:MAG: sugar transferase [Ardenticatenia bacterium]|nr:sugar transferase [Ardenticatenia bacterium]
MLRGLRQRRLFLLLLDVGLTELALFLAWQGRLHFPIGKPTQARVPLWLFLVVAIIWAGTFAVAVYRNGFNGSILDNVFRVLHATFFSALLFAGILYLTYRDLPRLLYVYFVVVDLLLIGMFHSVGLWLLRRWHLWPVRGKRRVVVLGAGETGQMVAEKVRGYRWEGLELVSVLDDHRPRWGQQVAGLHVHGPLERVLDMAANNEVEEVVFALPMRAHRRLIDLALELQRYPVRVRVVPDYFDLAFVKTTVENFGGLPMIGLRDPAIDGFQRLVKRTFDLVITIGALPFVLPVMGLIALAIKLDSPGPAIFKQERVGENGRIFTIYKFRTMVVDAEQRVHEVIQITEDGKIIHKRKDDPRVTRLGRFLRRTSLDELPQLFNVLKGEMSLVGPRPELPWLVDQYEPWQRKRFAVPQGITGWWQVNGRSDRPMHLHTEDDLYYIQELLLLA